MTTCSTGSSCTAGGTFDVCTTISGGVCTQITYSAAGQTFSCDCQNCNDAAQKASLACSGQLGVHEQCTDINTACQAGGTLSYCITYDDAVCSSIVYRWDGEDFPCNSCQDCQQAGTDASYACAGIQN